MEQEELHSPQLVNVELSIYPFFLNMETEISIGRHAKTETKRGKPYHKTIAAVFLASPFEVKTMSGQTLMLLLTTSNSPGRGRSPVSIALRKDCLDCNQSRCSAPLRLVAMNSVIENGSSVPNTVEAVFCRQRWSNLTSKVG